MSLRVRNRHTQSFAGLILSYGLIWLVLMILLGITLGTAYLRLGSPLSSSLHLGIAALQVAILWLIFMDLLESSSLVRLAAMAGLFWIIFLFAMTFVDYFTRPWNGSGTSLSGYAALIGDSSSQISTPLRLPLDERK